MALKACFEIGHEASIKTKRAAHEVFTHDWEVFVRGADGADIGQFVDKVVFHLHETFPKPKRVVKEPPYSVKESGYAGFNFPIEIHLKNREEPKKIRFNYDLYLQQSGPSILRLQKEKYIFQNPSDEFRRKLLKGGATPTNAYPSQADADRDRNGADSFSDERQSQLIGKPKYAGGGDMKKSKPSKEHRPEEQARPSREFESLFGTPIRKTSISPDLKKPSPNPKLEKKDKEDKGRQKEERDRQKARRNSKEREHKEERKPPKEDKDKTKEDKKQKAHKDRDKEKTVKRPPERPPSPPPPSSKRQSSQASHSPRRGPSPSNKSNGSASGKEDSRQLIKPAVKLPEPTVSLSKVEKKSKKEKRPHDREKESKKERKDKSEKEGKSGSQEIKESKAPKETPREAPIVKEKPAPRPINKFSIENMLKDPSDLSKYGELKPKGDHEKKHKHKKKDKKRDESKDKNKDSQQKDRKHKHEKQKEKDKKSDNRESLNNIEKSEPSKDQDKSNSQLKSFKEKERNHYTISPVTIDSNSQSSSKSAGKSSKPTKSLHSSLSSTSDSESDRSVHSDSEDTSFNSETKNAKASNSKSVPAEQHRNEPSKSTVAEAFKSEKLVADRNLNEHKPQKNKEKASTKDAKEDKKQRKRKSGSKNDETDAAVASKIPKLEETTAEGVPAPKSKRLDAAGNKSSADRSKSSKTDTTKVQDDGVSSSLSDNPIKCESPATTTTAAEEERPKSSSREQQQQQQQHRAAEISPDYMVQLQELQRRIMTIQSNDELERVVNLIAETGKYEVTKKTFDFDLCLLDRRTVQQLQELIGCESRA